MNTADGQLAAQTARAEEGQGRLVLLWGTERRGTNDLYQPWLSA